MPPYRVIPIPQGSFYDAIFSGGQISAAKAFEYYSTTGAVGTAVDMIGDEVSNINPVLSSDGNLDSDNEVINFLKKPNDFDTWSVLFEDMAKNYLITGNFFPWVEGASTPVELYSVSPELVSGSINTIDGRPNSYQVSSGTIAQGTYIRNYSNNTIRFLNGELKELDHGNAYNPKPAMIMGQSLLQSIAQDVKQQILGKTHNLSLLNNGGRLSLAIIYKDDGITPIDEIKKRMEHSQEQLQGVHQAGKIATFAGKDLEMKEFGLTSKDMDYINLDNVSRHATYARYKIPLPLVSEKATQFKNYTAAIETLYDRAVIPVVNKLFQQLSLLLLPRYGFDTNKFKITYDPEQITALRTKMLAEIAERRNINIETINELRKDLPGKDPVEGGDVIYQSATLKPLGTDILIGENPDDELKRLMDRDV